MCIASRIAIIRVKIRFARMVAESFQLGILGLGLLQDGDVRVGVFPQREEILVGGTSLVFVACESVGPAQFQVCQCADGLVYDKARVVTIIF